MAEKETPELSFLLPGHSMVQVTAGPYAGKRLQVPDADAAVSEGWAYKEGENPLDIPEVKELSPEDQHAVVEKAKAAGKKLRDDDDEAEDREQRKERKAQKNLEAAEQAPKSGYTTRDMKSKK
jgi:hypothetical protein